MANCIAEASGYDKNRVKLVHRLGSEGASAKAATHHTFVDAYIHKDGSGGVTVTRGCQVIHRFEFGPEQGE
ncbi:MAG: hypothetical protein ACOY58_04885 [Candidatus Micrarchaeota archaeon]